MNSMLQKYNNPKTTKENIKELQELLVQTIINYCVEHNLQEIDEVNFNVDGLSGDSFREQKWTPGTDSYIEVIGLQPEGKYMVRKFIGDYY